MNCIVRQLVNVLFSIILPLYGLSQDLSNIPNSLPTGARSITLTADVDKDGMADLFIAGEDASDNFAKIFKNNGDSTFSDLGLGLTFLFDGSACFTDLNNDSYVDLIYTGRDGSFNYYCHIYINQQNSTFSQITHTITGVRLGQVVSVDMNNDGWKDIFISGFSQTGNDAALYQNNTDLSFSKVTFGFEGLRNCGVVIADFDHNTFPDIVYSGLDASLTVKTLYYQNQGEMQFVEKSNDFPGVQLGGLASFDINNDGFVDIALFGKDNTDTHIAKVYSNNSGLSFTFLDDLTGLREGALKSADFDNDGYTDVIQTGLDATDAYHTLLYVNNAGTGFLLETDTIAALGYSDAAWVDFNNDNKNDLLLCGTTLSESKSILLSSNTSAFNQNPSVITGLSSTCKSDTVNLSWDLGNDNETTSSGLSYELYLQSNATTDIDFYPVADLSTGERYVMQPGTFNVTSLELTGLPEGKYWWSVQSVDAALEGSSFATADTFYISQPIDLGDDITVCMGDSLSILLGDQEGTIEWYHTNDPGVVISTANQIKIEINSIDTIWAVVTKSYGDSVSDTLIVNIYDLPQVALGNDTSICYGEEIELTIGSPTDTVDWYTQSGTYTENNSYTFMHPFYASDAISAEITDLNGCVNSDTLLLTILPLPAINLVNDTSICLQDTLQIQLGSVFDSINWYSLSGGSDILNSNNLEYIASQDGVYRVEWFNNNQCVNYDTINIFARSMPVPEAGVDHLICAGYDVEIGPDTIIEEWQYNWTGNFIVEGQNSANPVVNPNQQTQYTLTVIDQFGCSGVDSITVNMNPVGSIDAGEDKAICIGDSVTIGGNPTAEGSTFPYSYEWSPATSLSDPASANPLANPDETTFYILVVFTGECPVDTQVVQVTVNELPVITLINDTIAGFREDMPLWAEGGVDYEWSPQEGLDNAFVSNPVANIEQTSRFLVNVTDEHGCQDTASVTVSVLNSIFIPNLFTPNNDLSNDEFKIFGIGVQELELIIYNSEGIEVFHSKDRDMIMEEGWDGTFNGFDAKDGKYFWTISGTYFNGSQINYNGKNKGIVTLLR